MFFCIGAQKAGTTTLNDILKQNPEICLPREKETHFFSLPEKNRAGALHYFQVYFEANRLSECSIVGEVDPSYCFFEGTADRIFEQLAPNYSLKFIFILRDPVRRAYSHYLMSWRRGFETLGFKEALKKEASRVREPFGRNQFSYVTRGYYHKQIEAYLRFFDVGQFLFLSFEDDLIAQPPETFKRIHEFLGLEPFNYRFDLKSNPASKPRSTLIRDMIFKDSPGKRLLKKLIPSDRLKQKVRAQINRLNSRKDTVSRLSPEVYREIWQTYYPEEIDRLRALTPMEFKSWNTS
jgi:hypothetical protein